MSNIAIPEILANTFAFLFVGPALLFRQERNLPHPLFQIPQDEYDWFLELPELFQVLRVCRQLRHDGKAAFIRNHMIRDGTLMGRRFSPDQIVSLSKFTGGRDLSIKLSVFVFTLPPDMLLSEKENGTFARTFRFFDENALMNGFKKWDGRYDWQSYYPAGTQGVWHGQLWQNVSAQKLYCMTNNAWPQGNGCEPGHASEFLRLRVLC